MPVEWPLGRAGEGHLAARLVKVAVEAYRDYVPDLLDPETAARLADWTSKLQSFACQEMVLLRAWTAAYQRAAIAQFVTLR